MTVQDQGLFDDTVPEVNNPNVTYYDQFVGEGKKFKDNEALARAKAEADAFIDRLQNETAVLREELKKRETMDEIVARLTKSKPSDDTVDEEVPPPRAPGSDKNGLTQDDVKQLLSKELSDLQEKDRRTNNARVAREELVKRFGPDWQTHLKARQAELDVTAEFLTDLAETQPRVFIQLVGDAPRRDPLAPPSSTFDAGKRPSNTGARDWQYYEKLRKENFNEYMSPRVQNEMHDQLMKMGEASFFRK